jgi:hypothetical protein
MEIHRRKGPSPTVWECPWRIVFTRNVKPIWWGCFGPFLGTLQNHSEGILIILVRKDAKPHFNYIFDYYIGQASHIFTHFHGSNMIQLA